MEHIDIRIDGLAADFELARQIGALIAGPACWTFSCAAGAAASSAFLVPAQPATRRAIIRHSGSSCNTFLFTAVLLDAGG